MRKVFIGLFFLFGGYALVQAQPITDHLFSAPMGMSRSTPFRSITENSELIFKGHKTPPHRQEQQYDRQGCILSQISYNSSGGVSSETYWEYDEGNRLIGKKHRFFANFSGWNEVVIVIKRDSISFVPVGIEEFKNDKLVQWAVIMVDTLNRIEMARVFGPSGAHTFTEKMMYITRSNIVKVNVYRANGVHASTWSYPIDAQKPMVIESVTSQRYPNGDVMLEKLAGANMGDQAYYYEYEYDSKGNWIEKSTYQVTLGKKDKIKKKKLENRITRSITYQ